MSALLLAICVVYLQSNKANKSPFNLTQLLTYYYYENN